MKDIDLENAIKVDTVAGWRDWLAEHGKTEKHVVLIVYHTSSRVPSVHWHEAIEHALCYGWVDSIAKKRDHESCYLKFSRRNPKSSWGKKNVERVKRMMAQGLMTETGYEAVENAKNLGKWKEDA